jgi:hypothetical protein
MDQEKNKIIIHEIRKWRRSRLIPEQYCDFLLNLYGEGEQSSRGQWFEFAPALEAVRRGRGAFWTAAGAIALLIAFIVFNFNSFHFLLQISIFGLSVIFLYLLGFLLSLKKKWLSNVCFAAASFLLLFLGEYMLRLYDAYSLPRAGGYYVLCCVVWMVLGWLSRQHILHFCGLMGIILFYGWVMHMRLTDAAWGAVQMYWIPLAVVLLWFGWLFHVKNKAFAAVYFAAGALVWILPDVYLVWNAGARDLWTQLLFAVKLAMAGAALFLFRQKWTVWFE